MSTNDQNLKNWWAPVWKGLVFDREGRHCRQMKNAIWLFVYFLLCAGRGNGCLKRKIGTIMSDTGFSRDMIVRWLKALRNHGYIETSKTGRCLSIRVKKWKTSSEGGNIQLQKSEISGRRCWKNPITHGDRNGRNFSHVSQILEEDHGANDNTITKDIIKNDIDSKRFPDSEKPFKGSDPEKRSIRLALELARALDDLKGIALYRSYAKKYPEPILRRVLEKVIEIPAEKIKKSRGAFFNYLIQKYGAKMSRNLSD